MDNYINILTKLPLFNGISKDNIPILLKRLETYIKSYKKDEYIKLSGDPANFIGIVLSGNIQILTDDFYGKRSITSSLNKGALFAEAFACAGLTTLPVDILSCDDTDIMFINSDKLFSSCSTGCEFHHTIIENLLNIVAKKNLMLNQKLQYISHKTTREKIMAYLNDQAKKQRSNEFTIPFDRQSLADYLGVERSAMSAEISKLVKQGIIETNRSSFKILKHFHTDN